MDRPLPTPPNWPDAMDIVALSAFFLLMVGVPIAGIVYAFVDVRRWTRRLHRALVVVTNYLPDLPEWSRGGTPRCVAALGLDLPCTVHDVKEAYRRKVKEMHPDLGGDQRRFMWLQSQFELALACVEAEEKNARQQRHGRAMP